MRIYDDEITAFLLGGACGWAATFFALTRDKRLVGRIRSQVSLLSTYSGPKAARVDAGRLASDQECLDAYAWARSITSRKTSSKKRSPVALAAQVLICEKALGLTAVHASRAIYASDNLGDLESKLKVATDEIASDERFQGWSRN